MASNRKEELLALLKGAKEAMNGQSLAVWDKMWLKDRDPESAGGAALAYPLQRVFNIGIHVEL